MGLISSDGKTKAELSVGGGSFKNKIGIINDTEPIEASFKQGLDGINGTIKVNQIQCEAKSIIDGSNTVELYSAEVK